MAKNIKQVVFKLEISYNIGGNEVHIKRKAITDDLSKVAEIYVFNNRINFLHIKEKSFSFGELQVYGGIQHDKSNNF